MAGRGRGRGRGGGGVTGRAQILGGVEMTWDYDPDMNKDDYEPEEPYPPIAVPEPRRITPLDYASLTEYKAVRDRCRLGPLHAILGDSTRVGKDKRPKNHDYFFNQCYSSTFPKRQPQYLPRLHTRQYKSSIFSEQLQHVLDPGRSLEQVEEVESYGSDVVDEEDDDKDETESEPEDGEEAEDGGEAEERREKKASAAAKVAEALAKKEAAKEYAARSDLDSDDSRDDDFEAEDEEEQDDTFEEDEEDQAGDYNAEGYFDNGDEDGDSLDGGGDEGQIDY